MTDNDKFEDNGAANFRRAIILLLGGVAVIFLAGMLTGYVSAVLEEGGFTLTSGLVSAGIALALAVVGILTWRQFQKRSRDTIAPSEHKSRTIYIASMVLGGLLGFYIMLTGGPELDTLFSNSPISSTAAAGAIVGFGILMPVITLLWWRATDEHELKAYTDGANFAFHLYVFIVPCWWMAARAGWVPQQDPMIVFAIVMVIWSAVWLFRKYR